MQREKESSLQELPQAQFAQVGHHLHHIFLETPHGLIRERYILSDVLAQQDALPISWFATTSQQTPGSGLTQEEISLCHAEITCPLSVMTLCFSLEVSGIDHQMMHITVPMISTFWI